MFTVGDRNNNKFARDIVLDVNYHIVSFQLFPFWKIFYLEISSIGYVRRACVIVA